MEYRQVQLRRGPVRLSRMVVGGRVFGELVPVKSGNGQGSPLKVKSKNTIITVLGILPKFSIILSVCFFSVCGPPQKKNILTPEQWAEFQKEISQADILLERGSYTALKEAFQIYRGLLDFPVSKNKIRVRVLKTALLLGQREDELGIIDDNHLQTAWDYLQVYPDLSEFSSIFELILRSSSKRQNLAETILTGRSSIGDNLNWFSMNINPLNTQLKAKSEEDVFSAYFYIHLNSDFDHYLKKKDDCSRFSEIFPGSALIQFKLAVSPKIVQDSLTKLVREDSSFFEAHYFLGKIDLMLGKIISAEKKILLAYANIPRSIPILSDLAKIYFVLEEFQKCLEFNQKILALDPDYRDALLAKAICLGYMEHHEEAVEILDRLRGLGQYLMGETNYWLAWNRNELNKHQEAWTDIEKAKKYLIGHHEVHTLSGIIAFKLDRLEEAEKDFEEAVKLSSPSCEPVFFLGKIFAHQESWEKSAFYFEKASRCYQEQENSLCQKIDELESSSLSEDRKKRHILRKKIQIAKTRLSEATSLYNAAAGYFNAGQKEKALPLAQRALRHDSFKAKADDLIKQIKKLDRE